MLENPLQRINPEQEQITRENNTLRVVPKGEKEKGYLKEVIIWDYLAVNH